MDELKNIFTVDLEEWFVVEILSKRYSSKDWSNLQSTVEKSVSELLHLLRKHNVKATWFVLGWCADKYPALIQEIFNQGHEIACHSYYHRRVDLIDPDTFKKDTELAINAIVKAIGNVPHGYRAPTWSINSSNAWAFEILANLGFLYDSSVFPIKHDIYGWIDGPRHTFKMEFENGNTLYEVPATTFKMFGKNFPAGGGGYFRHSPYNYSKKIMEQINRKDQPVVFYIHPWEICTELPKIEGLNLLEKFRTYSSTGLLKDKIDKLLTDFSFTTISDHLGLFTKNRIGF